MINSDKYNYDYADAFFGNDFQSEPLCWYLYIRETPAFGGISLDLWSSGAPGAAFETPSAPIWETTVFGHGERKKEKIGAPAPL